MNARAAFDWVMSWTGKAQVARTPKPLDERRGPGNLYSGLSEVSA
jgi:hypothetical protein